MCCVLVLVNHGARMEPGIQQCGTNRTQSVRRGKDERKRVHYDDGVTVLHTLAAVNALFFAVMQHAPILRTCL